MRSSWLLFPERRMVPTGTRSPRMCEVFWRFQNLRCIRVLRRLQKDECLEAYNMEYAGRNRKYYKLTDKGAAQLNLYRSEWEIYSSKITRMFEEGV